MQWREWFLYMNNVFINVQSGYWEYRDSFFLYFKMFNISIIQSEKIYNNIMDEQLLFLCWQGVFAEETVFRLSPHGNQSKNSLKWTAKEGQPHPYVTSALQRNRTIPGLHIRCGSIELGGRRWVRGVVWGDSERPCLECGGIWNYSPGRQKPPDILSLQNLGW